jgi:RNA polymerase sigma factor (sigma-70 family)
MDTIADKKHFFELIQKNKGIILKICNSYCRNKCDREDLAQEIIYNLWKSGKKFDPDYKFSTWMYRIALNVAISFFRKEKKAFRTFPAHEVHLDIEDSGPNEDDSAKQIQLLQRFINELKELDKALILLSFESNSYREIAEITGISESNVATRISRIKERLKQQFANHLK